MNPQADYLEEQLRLARAEIAELRKRVAAAPAPVERVEQESVATVRYGGYTAGNYLEWSRGAGLQFLAEGQKLYVGQANPPRIVAYLDIGAGGYIDLGSDLEGGELESLPFGRHVLGIVGTYGADGYVPATPQPAPTAALVTTEECPHMDELHSLDKQCRDDVARSMGMTPVGDGYPWSGLLAGIKSMATRSAAQDVAGLVEALEWCEKWFSRHSPTAALISGEHATHPMLSSIRAALAAHQSGGAK